MKHISHKILFLLTIWFICTATVTYSSVILNFEEAVIPDQTISSVPIGDFKNESQYNNFYLATSDNYNLLLINSPWKGVWSTVRLTHSGELIDTIPQQLRSPDDQFTLTHYFGLTWESPYFYLWEGGDGFVYYTRFTEDLTLIDESPRQLASIPKSLLLGGSEAWTISDYRQVWGYNATQDSTFVSGVEITGWRPFTGLSIGGLVVDDGIYLTRRNPIDSITDLAHVSRNGEVKVLAPLPHRYEWFGAKYSNDSVIFWNSEDTFEYFFASSLDSLASETLHKIDLSTYTTRTRDESFAISGNTGVLTGRMYDSEYRRYNWYTMSIDLLTDSVISINIQDTQNYFSLLNPTIAIAGDTSSIFYLKYNGIEMTKLLNNNLSTVINSQPVLYGLGHHSKPSMIKDSLGLLIYLLSGNKTGTSIHGYRWNEPLLEDLINPIDINPSIVDSAVQTPHLFNVGTENGLYWIERFPNDSLGNQSKSYEHKVVLFKGNAPLLGDLTNTYIMDTTVYSYNKTPATVRIRDTLYIMNHVVGERWALKSIDLLERQKSHLELSGLSFSSPILVNQSDSLYRLGLYFNCLEWSPPNVIFCIKWKYFLYSRGYINDTTSTYFEGWLPGVGSTYYPEINTNIKSAFIDSFLYIGVADPPAIQKIELSSQKSTTVVDLSNLLSTPLNYFDSKPMITLTQYQDFRIVLYFRHDINIQEAFVFDNNWQLISQQEIPVIGAIQELAGVEMSRDSSSLILAYTSFLPYPYSTERLVIQPFTLDVSTDIDEDYTTLPESYSISHNYPNPFNPTTTIDYTIPVNSHITISIFNLLGQEVMTILNETKPAGKYSIKWNSQDSNGNPVASGIYFYQLKSGDFVESKKMLLLK